MKTTVFKFISLFLFLFFIQQSFRAQIICTDVIPDITNTGNATMDIDLNNDAIPDFRITSAQAGVLSFVVVQGSQIGTSNFVLTNGAGNSTALPLNAPISPTSTTWTQMNSTNQQMVTVTSAVASGPWAGAIDQYLGLKLIVGLNTYYGWARFSFTSNSNTYTFKDYAYESTSGSSILAGQGCGSITAPTFSLAGTLCTGNSATLTANTGTSAATTYSWASSPTGPVFTAPASSVTGVSFSAPGLYSISLAVSSGTNVGMATNTIQVNPLPTVTVSPNTATICQGSTVSITTNGSAASYSWSPGLGLSTTSGTNVVANPISSQIYTISGSLNGCATNATVGINVTSAPSASLFTINVNGPTLCAQPLVISVNSSTISINGLANYSYSPLSSPTLSGSTLSFNSIVFNTIPPYQSVSGPVTTTVQASNGTCLVNIPVTFSIIANPLLAINSISPSVCKNVTYIYTATGCNSYIWLTTMLGSIISVTNNLANVNPSATAVYSVFGTSQGCYSPMLSSTLTVLPLPALSITDATACVNESAALSVSGALTYAWSGPGGFTSNLSTVTVPTGTAAGITVYAVTGTGANACFASASVSLTTASCVELIESLIDKPLQFYPNPFYDNLIIESAKEFEGNFEVISVQGEIVLRQEKVLIPHGKSSIDLGGIPNGLYLVRMFNGTEMVFFRRLVKL